MGDGNDDGYVFFILMPPADEVAAAAGTDRVKLAFLEAISIAATNITSLTCTGTTPTFISSPPVVAGEINLATDTSCNLVAEAAVGPAGATATYSVTLSRNGDKYSLVNGTISGDIADVVPPVPVITDAPLAHDSITPFDITYTFGVPVNSFNISKMEFRNGDAVLKSGSGGDTVFVVTITPATDSSIRIDSKEGLVFDSNGIASLEAEDNTDVNFVSTKPLFNKTFAPASIRTGEASTLTFTIEKSATTTVTGLSFDDTLPVGSPSGTMQVAASPNASHTCGSGTLTAAAGSTTISYSGGILDNATDSCTVSVDVTADETGTYNNVSGDLTSNHGNSGTASASLVVVEKNADINVTIAVDKNPVAPGETLTYTLSVENGGPQTATSPIVNIVLPSNVTLTSTDGCTTTDPNGVPTCPLNDLTGGAVRCHHGGHRS